MPSSGSASGWLPTSICDLAAARLKSLAPELGEAFVTAILTAPQVQESEIRAQRIRVAELKTKLLKLADRNETARDLLSVVDHLVRRSIWIVGGDGWAYDIGYGGLDHVLATGRNVNILVLDTEVYSNTGGQASKATPLGAIAKFAAAGKRVARKDLALQAIAYGNVYVAQVAMGANPQQTLQAFREAEAYEGTSLILAYSHCIAHGFDLRYGMKQQDLATASGYWPLFRYNPAMRKIGESPFRLDSPRPTIPFKDYAYNELRYQALALTRPAEAAALLRQAQTDVDEKYRIYEEFASLGSGPAPAQVTTAVAKALDACDDRLTEQTSHGSDDALSGAHSEQSARGRRRPAHRGAGQYPATGGSRRGRGGAALDVRGTDRAGAATDRSSDNDRQRTAMPKR